MTPRRPLVVGAHSADFVWRSAGAIAAHMARGGEASPFETVPPSELLVFEPHQPELCGFTPSLFVDITSVFDRKIEAMGCMRAQKYLQEYYAQRAEHRGNHARKVTGDQQIRQAEAFQRLLPNVVEAL